MVYVMYVIETILLVQKPPYGWFSVPEWERLSNDFPLFSQRIRFLHKSGYLANTLSTNKLHIDITSVKLRHWIPGAIHDLTQLFNET